MGQGVSDFKANETSRALTTMITEADERARQNYAVHRSIQYEARRLLVEREIRATMDAIVLQVVETQRSRCLASSCATFACQDVLEGKLKRNNASQMKNVEMSISKLKERSTTRPSSVKSLRENHQRLRMILLQG